MTNLVHHFLIPTDKMKTKDSIFAEKLIYIYRHQREGVLGCIVNIKAQTIPLSAFFGELLGEMGIHSDVQAMNIDFMYGGDIKSSGFILHTGLPKFTHSIEICENVCLTPLISIEIFPELLPQGSVDKFMALLGFCAWEGDTLEREIKHGDWLVLPADTQTLFLDNPNDKINHLYQKFGINPDKIVSTIGHC